MVCTSSKPEKWNSGKVLWLNVNGYEPKRRLLNKMNVENYGYISGKAVKMVWTCESDGRRKAAEESMGIERRGVDLD